MQLKTDNAIDYINKVINFRKDIFSKIASKNENQIWLRATLRDIKKIVIIHSASRSGSSLLFAILRKIPRVYSLSGESTPFYRLNGFFSDVFPSEKIPEEPIRTIDNDFNMSRGFLSDFSIIESQDDVMKNRDLLNQYIDDLALRFSMQWPVIDFSYDIFKDLAVQAFNIYLKRHKRFYKEEFYLELLSFLRSEYGDINPYYYDIPENMVKRKFPDIRIPSGPPNNVVMIEEPPFILLSPGRKVNKEDLSKEILLLKSSVDAYRMNYIESIFPQADIKVIYLIRNPLASINGLYDGWLYRGFFSHNLKNFFRDNKRGLNSLKISGYSDKYEWGKWWWNYDLPPGWQDYAERSLEEVCAFQWYSANKAIQEYIDNATRKVHQTKYENIVRSLDSRVREIGRIIDFIGISQDAIKDLSLDKLPVVQATQPPKPYRWKKRRDILLPIINNPKISRMSTKLGYDKERVEEWL